MFLDTGLTIGCAGVFFLSVVGHLLGDFALQSDQIAINKSGVNKYMLAHVLLVTALTVFPLALLLSPQGIAVAFVAVLLAHILVDNAKRYLTDRTSKSMFWKVLAFDQIIHISVIYAIIVLFGACT